MNKAVTCSGNWFRPARITVNTTEAVEAEIESAAHEERRSTSDIINNLLTAWAMSRAAGRNP
jgi:hypothetical protein